MHLPRRVLNTAVMSAVIACIASAQPRTTFAQSNAAKLNDPTIVAIFDAANTYDIQTSSIAVSKGHSRAIRDFAAMLVRDHRNVRMQGRNLAASLKVTPTPPRDFPLAKAHRAAMAALRHAHGREFDRVYLRQEVDFHNAVIDAVTTTLLPAIQNAQLKDLVTKVAPAFVAHRDRAQTLLNEIK